MQKMESSLSPFLSLMKEKEAKKIKASGMPAKLAGYLKRNKGPPAKLAGYFKRNKEARAKLHVSGQNSPAAEAALIFFCFLFFYQEKKRRDAFCEREETSVKLQETIMRSKKVPGKLLCSRFRAFS